MFDRFWERLEEAVWWGAMGIAGTIASGGWWLIRRVFTNQQQIEALQAEIKHRDQLRQEDREQMTKIETSVERIEGVLMRVDRKVDK